MKSQKIFLTLGFLFSFAVIITALVIARNRISTSGRAEEKNSIFSSIFSKNNSYIFASPISAQADGLEVIRITVFLLDSQGLGVAGQKVSLNTGVSLLINDVLPVTDENGKAIFDISSETAGDYTISVSAANQVLQQQVTISFH